MRGIAACIVVVDCKIYFAFAMAVDVRNRGEAGVGSLGPYRIGTRFWVGSTMRGSPWMMGVCCWPVGRQLSAGFIAGARIEQKSKRYIDDIATDLDLLTS